jgi:hypothetical protein
LNKPIIKSKLEAVPESSSVIIDLVRADFIDKDVVEVIEDFMKHAPLKDIKVELRKKIQNNTSLNGSMNIIPSKQYEHESV